MGFLVCLFLFGAVPLWQASSVIAAWGLNCPMAYRVFVPPTRDWTHIPCIGIMWILFFFFSLYLFIFWLHWFFCCMQAFPSCSEQGLLSVGVHGVLECGSLATGPPGGPGKFTALLLSFLYWDGFGSTAPSYFGVPGGSTVCWFCEKCYLWASVLPLALPWFIFSMGRGGIWED